MEIEGQCGVSSLLEDVRRCRENRERLLRKKLCGELSLGKKHRKAGREEERERIARFHVGRIVEFEWRRVGGGEDIMLRDFRYTSKRRSYESKVRMQIGGGDNTQKRRLAIRSSDDEETREKKRIKKTVEGEVGAVPGPGDDPSPELSGDFQKRIGEMNGTQPILVLQKKLFKTDIEVGENRLSIPVNQIRREFLTEEEKMRMADGMQVRLIEPNLAESTITFKKWNMKKNCSVYVFMKQWKSVVHNNSLRSGTPVQIWSFRVGSELRFALVKLGRETERAT